MLNGSGDIVYTRTVASRVQALSYRVTHVGKASSFNYPQTQVYYPPGGEAIGVRLAKQLDVPVQPLPGGTDPAPRRDRRAAELSGTKRGQARLKSSLSNLRRGETCGRAGFSRPARRSCHQTVTLS